MFSNKISLGEALEMINALTYLLCHIRHYLSYICDPLVLLYTLNDNVSQLVIKILGVGDLERRRYFGVDVVSMRKQRTTTAV